MIARVPTLYRQLLRRDIDRDDAVDVSEQIRFPLTDLEYVEVFGMDRAGVPARVLIQNDGSLSIVYFAEDDITGGQDADLIDAPVGVD